MNHYTDEELVALYIEEGQEVALVTLVDRYMNDAYRFARSIVHDDQIAQDIVQESFVKAWRHIRRFISRYTFRAWLFTIIKRTAIDALRAKKAVTFSTLSSDEESLEETIADMAPLPDELIARVQDERYIAAILAQINPDYAEVLTLRYTSDMTFEQIGDMLKRPLHTVKSQYRRGLAACARILERAR